METGIARQNIYRYMKDRKNRLVPNPKTTARIIKSLASQGRYQDVISFLSPAANRMREVYLTYFRWKKSRGYSPFSPSEIAKLERSLPGLPKEKDIY